MSHWWCCCTCLLYSTRFPTSSVLDDWTGTGSIVSEELQLTGTSTTILYDTPHPQYPYPPRVIVNVKGGANSELRVLFSWSANYGFVAELSPDSECGSLALYQVIAGVESEMLESPFVIPGASVDQWHRISACYDPRNDGVTVVVLADDGQKTTVRATADTAHVDGEYAGLGTGATHTGTAYFDNFAFWRLWYYGDGEQDDYDEETDVIECSPCAPGDCAWIDAQFESSADLCAWQSPGSDWSITTSDDGYGVLQADIDSGVLLHQVAYPDNPEWVYDDKYQELLIWFRAPDENQAIRAVICAEDTSNYLAAEVTVAIDDDHTCGKLRLLQVSGGSESVISREHIIPTIVEDTWYYLYVRYDGYRAEVSAQVYDGNEAFDFYATQLGHAASTGAIACDGDYVGVGVASAAAYGSGSGIQVGTFLALTCTDYEYPCFAMNGGYGQFARNATLTLSDDWELISGTEPTLYYTAIYADYVVKWTTGQSGMILCQDPAPYDIEDQYTGSTNIWGAYGIGVVFNSDATGDNYLLAEFASGVTGWALSLYEVNSGVRTLLDSTESSVTLGGEYGTTFWTIRFCWDNGTAYAHLEDATVWRGGLTKYGPYHGLSAYNISGSQPNAQAVASHANDIDETYGSPCAPCAPDCSACEDGVQPSQLIATIAGVEVDDPIYHDGSYYSTQNHQLSLVNTDHYADACYRCRWVGPAVQYTFEWVTGGNAYTQYMCFWVVIWLYRTPTGYLYLYGSYVQESNGPYLEEPDMYADPYDPLDCDDVRDNGCYAVAEGAALFNPILLAGPGETIDCYNDLDGLVLSQTGSNVTATIQVPDE